MSALAWSRGLALLGVAALMVGCTQTGTPEPIASVSVSSGSSSSTAEPSPLPTRLPDLGEEAYPTEVGGFTMVWMSQPVYDRGDVSTGDRIVVTPELRVIRAEEYFIGQEFNHEELRPGVWCYSDDRDNRTCTVNSESGRLFRVRDMFESLTLDELAEWTAEFIPQVP